MYAVIAYNTRTAWLGDVEVLAPDLETLAEAVDVAWMQDREADERRRDVVQISPEGKLAWLSHEDVVESTHLLMGARR